MNVYEVTLTVVGFALLGAAWVPHLVKSNALTFPILYMGVGMLIFALGVPLPSADPMAFPVITERLTELTVLVALVSVGLRIDTRFSWKRWSLTWRLLGFAMPLTILAGFALGYWWLGYGLATAVLLAAVLAPTDPVLASDVQVNAPGEGGEDPVRLALTTEAGLNDGLAFPFVGLAIALALANAEQPFDLGHWLAVDLIWKVLGGAAIGLGVGYALLQLIFRFRSRPSISESGDGLTALAITLVAYGVAELFHTYGFLAVFVAAVVIRQQERDHDYHATLDTFAQQCEKMLMAIMLILVGGALVSGVLSILGWKELAFALAFVFVVRPLVGWISLLGSTVSGPERAAIAVFGVRGVGSIYYLAYALNHASFPYNEELWGIVALVILISVLVHGLSARPVMRWLDRSRAG